MKILSGTFPDESGRAVTTGTPIALLIENVDQRSKDYSEIKDTYRPGHADYTYDAKYGLRDYRGGGRQSARETAARVAAGAIARKIVPGMAVRGALIQVGPHRIDRARWDWNHVGESPFFCPDRRLRRKDHRVPRRCTQARLFHRRRDRGGGRQYPRRPRRAGLRQARCGPRGRADEHQCRERCRDRRRLRDRGHERRGERRRDAHGQ